MAVVHEHDDGDGGSSAAVVAIFLIALIVILAILFYGFAVAHWFGGISLHISVISEPAPRKEAGRRRSFFMSAGRMGATVL